MVTQVSGKRINVEWVKGPVGVQSRNLRQRTHLLARLARPVSALEGIRRT